MGQGRGGKLTEFSRTRFRRRIVSLISLTLFPSGTNPARGHFINRIRMNSVRRLVEFSIANFEAPLFYPDSNHDKIAYHPLFTQGYLAP